MPPIPGIFISHSSIDDHIAGELYRHLDSAGIGVWMDRFNIRPGDHWDMEIQQALRDCGVMLVVHTAASFASRTVWDEFSYFLNRNKTVIPLVFEKVELPFRLEQVQYIDFVSQPYKEAIAELLSLFVPDPSPTDPVRVAVMRENVPVQHKQQRKANSGPQPLEPGFKLRTVTPIEHPKDDPRIIAIDARESRDYWHDEEREGHDELVIHDQDDGDTVTARLNDPDDDTGGMNGEDENSMPFRPPNLIERLRHRERYLVEAGEIVERAFNTDDDDGHMAMSAIPMTTTAAWTTVMDHT